MGKRIYKCLKCGRYTLRTDTCPVCGSQVAIAHPPRFSLVDKYGRYRRLLKKSIGLLPTTNETEEKKDVV